ncbi:processed acidic surface protein [Bacillus salipaludis]|uniref:Processed acidic surface protein n=1 Tax=Bacillus salipaludis TaxID=2547811 RepID=A0A4R5VR65_9BACI|nr:processed acidic surface protein [Bacillus salipaludis]TDK61045.1 processed acidic surface protein [Bacillus salipaludis]
MFYKKTFLTCLLSILLLSYAPFASATPPENELNQYLTEIGWTKQELLDYLDYYEIPLEDFNSVEELKSVLGTPINAKNLQDLLTKYKMKQSELNALLDHFGDSLNDYKFIEDLDASVGFYTNHDKYMASIEDELQKIGITEQEVENFFTYLSQVEENNKDSLDQMESLDYRLEQFMNATDPSAELTEEQLTELTDILTTAFDLYGIQVKLKNNNKDISLKNLLKMAEPPGNLYTGIYTKTGAPLIDFTLPAGFFEGLMAGYEEMLHLGELSDEFVDFLHQDKYNNSRQYK